MLGNILKYLKDHHHFFHNLQYPTINSSHWIMYSFPFSNYQVICRFNCWSSKKFQKFLLNPPKRKSSFKIHLTWKEKVPRDFLNLIKSVHYLTTYWVNFFSFFANTILQLQTKKISNSKNLMTAFLQFRRSQENVCQLL